MAVMPIPASSFASMLVRMVTARRREPGGAGGFGCGGHHGSATAGVDGQEACSGLGGGADGTGYCVGDVV